MFENQPEAEEDFLGAIIEYSQLSRGPTATVKYPKAKPGKTYEIIMIDYDRKQKTQQTDWLIWDREVAGSSLIQGFDVEYEGKV